MTRLYIDEQEVPISSLGFTSLDQILKHVEDTHIPPNTVIRQIHVDGLPLPSEQFDKDPASLLEHIDERERIEIFTASVLEVAKDSIREAISYLGRIEIATPSLASGFQGSPGPEAFESLRQFYEGFYWLNLLLERLERTFNLTLDAFSARGVTAREHLAKFGSILKQLIDSQERGDYVLVSDLLEYEILPMVPVWKEMFVAIAEKISDAQ